MLKDFLEILTSYATMLLVFGVQNAPPKKKVMNFQSQKNGKAISPFLSGWVIFTLLYNYIQVIQPECKCCILSRRGEPIQTFWKDRHRKAVGALY